MRGQIWVFFAILSLFIILIDLYLLRGISQLSRNLTEKASLILKVTHISITLGTLIFIFWLFLSREKYSFEDYFRIMTGFFGFFILVYIPKLSFILFQLIKDITDLGIWIVNSFRSESVTDTTSAVKISRTEFLLRAGLIISSIPFLSILYGILVGKKNIKISKIDLTFPDLPAPFDGTRIIQFSDLHVGSFGKNSNQVSRAVEIINSMNPDYILFTGDMVNNRALEMEPYIKILKKLKARRGKYSILGNHDYGMHFEWESESKLEENMNDLYSYEEQAGFKLLKNESVYLEKNGERIVLAGVENWGETPFPQLGDIEMALKGKEKGTFKILMSHDPSHWDAKILKKTDIDLTLSGHTHGMQFAIRIPGWKWSPVKLKYPRWSGLYREGNQYLYVNIGLGFIAFPGRVGTPPEITEFTLHSKV